MIDAEVVPAVRVKYLPKSKYQFLVEFDFHGLFAVPVFSISTQINPEFKDYFADADIAQIKIKIIDPAVMAKSDKHKELSLADISSGGEIDIADEDVESLFSWLYKHYTLFLNIISPCYKSKFLQIDYLEKE